MQPIRPLHDAIPPDRVQRVLVIKLRHHTDVLLSSPVFSVLKRHLPHARIDALVYADTAAMLSLHPAIDEVHVVERHWRRLGFFGHWSKEWHLFKLLRSCGYDLIVHLSEHPRGAWMARLLGADWAVAMSRHDPRWRNSFTHLYAHPRSAARHAVECNLDALRRIGIYPEPDERRLLLVPGREAEMRVAAKMRDLGISPGKFIQIHPASRWFFKCWPVEYTACLIEMLQATGQTVVLTAAPSRDEKILVEAIQKRLRRPALSVAGGLTVKDMAALAARSRLFIGVDSAPLHIATAVGTPVVALFGPSNEKHWGPWGVPHRVMKSEHSCRPCGMEGCGGGRLSDCLQSVTPEAVFVAVRELLAETELQASARQKAFEQDVEKAPAHFRWEDAFSRDDEHAFGGSSLQQWHDVL